MSEFFQQIIAHRIILAICSTILTTVVLICYNKDSFLLWFKSLCFRFPLIGANQRLSKRLGLDDQNWFNAEREVCNAFLKDYSKYNVDKEHYQQSSIYLDKVGDKGVAPLRWYHWLGLSVLILIEASGFAYVLAGFTLQDASEALQKEAAIAIAVLISSLLVVLTHAMGAELYRNQQIDKVRLRWQNSNSKSNIIEPNNEVSLQTKRNHIDDNDSAWQQMANRLNKVNANFSKSWIITSVTLVFVAMVAIGATYIRGQVLEKIAIEKVQGLSSEQTTVSFEDPFSTAPQEAINTNKAAEKDATEHKMGAYKKAGWTTFIILAMIFLAMQFYSIYLGFKTTFSGKESKEAYRAIHKFHNINDYISYYENKKKAVTRTAQQVLSHLQLKIATYARKYSGEQTVLSVASNPTKRNFLNFIKLDNLRQEQSVVLVNQLKNEETLLTTKGYTMADITEKVKCGDIADLSDNQIIEAMRLLNSKPQETAEERMKRLSSSIA